MLNKVKKLFTQPDAALRKIWRFFSPFVKDDKTYLSVMYFLAHGEKMNWENPTKFNEKLNWLKLWSKDKDFDKYVDKYAVREYVKQKIGEEYLIPCLGVWEKIEDIDYKSLPEKYVLKTTHDSGGIAIVNGVPTSEQLQKLKKHLTKNYFWGGREYPYLNVHPRIIAEKFMVDESGCDLKDYKFFCFNGEPQIMYLASERFKSKGQKAKYDFFDMDLKHLPVRSKGHKQNPSCAYPVIHNFHKMVELAKILSEGFPFIRIDFYNINGKVYFGEMTFFHGDAVEPLEPKEWNLKFGEMINLPNAKIE